MVFGKPISSWNISMGLIHPSRGSLIIRFGICFINSIYHCHLSFTILFGFQTIFSTIGTLKKWDIMLQMKAFIKKSFSLFLDPPPSPHPECKKILIKLCLKLRSYFEKCIRNNLFSFSILSVASFLFQKC